MSETIHSIIGQPGTKMRTVGVRQYGRIATVGCKRRFVVGEVVLANADLQTYCRITAVETSEYGDGDYDTIYQHYRSEPCDATA